MKNIYKLFIFAALVFCLGAGVSYAQPKKAGDFMSAIAAGVEKSGYQVIMDRPLIMFKTGDKEIFNDLFIVEILETFEKGTGMALRLYTTWTYSQNGFDYEAVGDLVNVNTPVKVIDDGEGFVLAIDGIYPSADSFLGALTSNVSYISDAANVLLSPAIGRDSENILKQLLGGMTLVKGSGDIEDFYILQTEVTQEMWNLFMHYNPSLNKGDKLPVESVSYPEAYWFISRLVQFTQINFRLPSVKEWVLAAKGTQQGWNSSNSGDGSHPCGEGSANPKGIFDMSGNVSEWCDDTITLPDSTMAAYYMGGSWADSPADCAKALTDRRYSSQKSATRGFRIVFDASEIADFNRPQDNPSQVAATNQDNATSSTEKPSYYSYSQVETKPTFKGGGLPKFVTWVDGMKVTPRGSDNKPLTGNVTVGFTVDVNGNVKDVSIIKSSNKALNAESVKVVRLSPIWTPGKQGGKAVPIRCVITIEY